MRCGSSLSALGRVIKALASGKGKGGDAQAHVPYRDATLTMLLRDSFGGKSSTSVVINVAGEAEHAEESICSLKFGERMSIVRNSPTVVTDSDAVDAAQVIGLLQRARQELAQMAADGLGGGFVDGCVNTEKQSLANNFRKLAAAQQEVPCRLFACFPFAGSPSVCLRGPPLREQSSKAVLERLW